MLSEPFGEIDDDPVRSFFLCVVGISSISIFGLGLLFTTCVILLGVVAFLVLTNCSSLIPPVSCVASLATGKFRTVESS